MKILYDDQVDDSMCEENVEHRTVGVTSRVMSVSRKRQREVLEVGIKDAVYSMQRQHRVYNQEREDEQNRCAQQEKEQRIEGK
jgi:hypothetical protein